MMRRLVAPLFSVIIGRCSYPIVCWGIHFEKLPVVLRNENIRLRAHSVITPEWFPEVPVRADRPVEFDVAVVVHRVARKADSLPYGYRTDIVRRDGVVTSGTMVPAPVWLITGARATRPPGSAGETPPFRSAPSRELSSSAVTMKCI
jgi:hypothetical protein